MPKSRKTKAKHQDFQKVKLKVGRRLPKGDNVTNASFKSRSIQIKEQLKTDSSQPTTKRKLNLNDLLSHCQHYNTSMRHEALKGLRELVSSHPETLHAHLSAILGRLSELFLDKDPVIRSTVSRLLKFILPQISANQIGPFFPILSAHLCCAMTHIQDEIQADSLTILDMCLEHFPALVTSGTSQILPNFVEQISRRSQTSKSGSAGSGERSLLINPASKMSSHKWRVKVLERLHKFLQALKNQSQPETEKLDKSQSVFCVKQAVNILPLGSFAVNSLSDSCFKLSSTSEKVGVISSQSGASQDLLSDLERLKSFIKTIVPLLLDCWVEVGPSQLATNLPGNALSPEGLSMLSSVLGVLLLLLQYMDSVDTDQDRVGMAWIQDRYCQDFVHHFMAHFPFSAHEPMREKSKGSGAKTDKPEVSIVSLNLTVSEIMSYFVAGGNKQMLSSSWFNQMTSYVTQKLSESKLSSDQLLCALRIMKKLTCLTLDEDVLESMLEASLAVIQNRHPNSADSKHLVRFFADLVTDSALRNLLRFSAVSSLLAKLPEMLSHLMETSRGHSGTTVSFLLRTINQVIPCGHPPLLNSLQSHLPTVIEHMDSLPTTEQRFVAELLYRIPSLDEQLLRGLNASCRRHSIGVSTVQYILQVLHARYLKEIGSNSEKTDPDLLQINFVLSLLIGYSSAELNKLSVEAASDASQFKLELTEQSQEEWSGRTQKAQCAVQILKEFPNSAQLWCVLQSFTTRLLNKYKVLPLSSAVSLLEACCQLCDSSAAINIMLLALLAKLVVAMETCIVMETKDQQTTGCVSQAMSLKRDTCQRSLGCLPGLSTRVVTVVQQMVSDETSNLESLRPFIVLLTDYLSSPKTKSQFTQSRSALVSVSDSLQTRFADLEACEWWHSFKYINSLL